MRPIPKSLLVHKVTLYTKVSGRWEETLGDDILLEHVRMEPSNQIIRDKQGAEQQLAAVLIYDCKNSRPGGWALRWIRWWNLTASVCRLRPWSRFMMAGACITMKWG